MIHNTADIRRIHCRSDETHVRKRSNDGILESPFEHKFPGLDVEQLHVAQEIAAATLKPGREQAKRKFNVVSRNDVK
jgi:hypothetical protein